MVSSAPANISHALSLFMQHNWAVYGQNDLLFLFSIAPSFWVHVTLEAFVAQLDVTIGMRSLVVVEAALGESLLL